MLIVSNVVDLNVQVIFLASGNIMHKNFIGYFNVIIMDCLMYSFLL